MKKKVWLKKKKKKKKKKKIKEAKIYIKKKINQLKYFVLLRNLVAIRKHF